MGESENQQILIHVWNYEVPLPEEYTEYDIDHREAMAAWCERALEITDASADTEVSSVFAEPVFTVDLGDCGGMIALY